jgi:phosphoglycolate phosphatase
MYVYSAGTRAIFSGREMTTIDSIVFDLDGTLWDTCESCAIAWNAVSNRLGIDFREITADDVRRVTGKPHEQCIRETFRDVPQDKLQALIELTMTEDNVMVQRHGGMLYDGVVAGLTELAASYRLFIVSNCQAGYIETFLEFAAVKNLLVDFECWGNTRKSKGENLASLIDRNTLKNPVMVGDMESDRDAATQCGIPFLHASYGFGAVSSNHRSFNAFGELVAVLRAINT